MKIIDYGKLLGSPIQSTSTEIIRIVVYKKLKKRSNGEKVLTIKSEDNPFVLGGSSSSRGNKGDSSYFYRSAISIINKKVENGEIEIIKFNNSDKKIKNIGHSAKNITEIDSHDPRLIIAWIYNQDIEISLYFKKKKVDTFNFNRFCQEFPKFEIRNKDHWRFFLSMFGTQVNEPIKGFGERTLIKYLKNFNEIEENLIHLLGERKLKKRLANVKELLEEMA